jgi:hypothetical protein
MWERAKNCLWIAWLLAFLVLQLVSPKVTLAHDFGIGEATLELEGDRYRLVLKLDADYYSEGRALNAEAAARGLAQRIEKAVRVTFDGKPMTASASDVRFHVFDAKTNGDVHLLTLAGKAPEGARSLGIELERAFPALKVHLLAPGGAVTATRAVLPGMSLRPFPMPNAPAVKRPEASQGASGRSSAGRVALDYVTLGFLHIVPRGLDHILFVTALVLGNRRLRGLLALLTAFTLAHSLTLALSALGHISLPSKPVEVVIALSVAYAAAEAVLRRQPSRWQPLVVFAFGLLHGLGFAGVLSELGLPAEHRVWSLAAFNVGVELGQISVVGALAVGFGWCQERPWFQRALVRPAATAVCVVALYWIAERMFA